MFYALLLTASYLPPQGCDTVARVQEMHAVQKRLFAIPEPAGSDAFEGEDDPKAVSIASEEVPALRSALSEAVTSFMQCDAGRLREPAVFEARLASLLGGASAPPALESGAELPVVEANTAQNTFTHTYGDSLTVHVEELQGMEDTLAVDLGFGIACGDDHVLLLFRRSAEGWQRVLEWKSKVYGGANDAFGDVFTYTAVPGPDAGSPLLVVAHGSPWCTSTMSGIAVDLLQPGRPDPVLQHVEREYRRWGNAVRFTRMPDGASLRVDADGRDSDNRMVYTELLRYRTTEGKLERLPTAASPLDFVDEWLGESWKVVEGWAARPDAKLEAMHATFGGDDPDKVEDKSHRGAEEAAAQAGNIAPGASSPEQGDKEAAPVAKTEVMPPEREKSQEDPLMFTFGSVRTCRLPKGVPKLPKLFQVELDLDSMKDDGESQTAFALVEQSGMMYRIRSVTKTADAACDGPDLNKKE